MPKYKSWLIYNEAPDLTRQINSRWPFKTFNEALDFLDMCDVTDIMYGRGEMSIAKIGLDN